MPIPNFLLMGPSKTGSTSLYFYLKQHPQIYMPSAKEPDFFAYGEETLKFYGPDDNLWYRNVITNWRDYLALFDAVTTETAIGEASQSNFTERAAGRIRQYIPHIKLVVVLRNPVDRAYSVFLHLRREGREPLSDFAQALQIEEKRRQDNWADFWFYKQKSFYFPVLKYYFDLFSREQIRVYLYEEISQNLMWVMENIFSFLGVNREFQPDTTMRYNVSGIPRSRFLHTLLRRPNSVKRFLKPFFPIAWRDQYQKMVTAALNRNMVKPPPLAPEIRQILSEEYREDILKVQDILKRDLSAWLRV